MTSPARNPLISIITISLNMAKCIEETIKSVISQSYPHLEYIIIDGGSQDGTVDIIHRYASAIKYWHSKPDRGIAHAFNQGLERAQGDWVLFLNADDYFMTPKVVEDMAPILAENSQADVVFGQVALVPPADLASEFPQAIYAGHAWTWRKFRLICSIPHQAAFTNRRYFHHVGWFDETYKIGMDYELFLRAGPRLTAKFVPQAVSAMCIGGNSGEVFSTLREWRRAQLQHRSAPVWLIWGNYLARTVWNRFQQHVLGRKYNHYKN